MAGPERTFAAQPVTMELDQPEGVIVVVVDSVTLQPQPEEGVPMMVLLTSGTEVRQMPVGEVTLDIAGQFEGTTVPNGYRLVLRQTTDHDAVASDEVGSTIPLPVAVISAIIHDEAQAMNDSLEALLTDDGQVLTLMLMTDVGAYLRYSGAWVDLLDVGQIDGYNVVPVQESALDIYDAFDQSGQSCNIAQLPPVDPYDVVPYAPGGNAAAAAGQTGVPGPIGTEPLTATGLLSYLHPDRTFAPVVTINSADDVPAAVEHASHDPSMRWYVERRVLALGVDVQLPWRDGRTDQGAEP